MFHAFIKILISYINQYIERIEIKNNVDFKDKHIKNFILSFK